jgi:hypothetical protein
MWSFFFQRVQGKIERKQIKTPTDSIAEFKGVFAKIIDHLHERNKEANLVIVIDNIDRIPPGQAREFWATMQTFFADGGDLQKPKSSRFWLIAPFSEEALTFIFDGDGGAKSKAELSATAKAYVDKTFGIAFFVPPPILANWRKFLGTKLEEAFSAQQRRRLSCPLSQETLFGNSSRRSAVASRVSHPS